MFQRLVRTLLVCILVEQGRYLARAQTCDGDGPCRCVMSDGSGTVDVSSIGHQDGTAWFQEVYSYDGIPFYYNPCFAFTIGDCKDAAVCGRDNTNKYISAGTQKSASWSYTGFYPMVTYTTSDGAKTEAMYICDPSFETPQLDVIGEITPGTVSMNIWTKCACPNTCKSVAPSGSDSEGLTPGSIMLIIFFTMLIVYLAAGVAYNYSKTKTVGKEMVPNLSFWSAMPGLVKDGFKFSWDKVCRRESKQEYEQLG